MLVPRIRLWKNAGIITKIMILEGLVEKQNIRGVKMRLDSVDMAEDLAEAFGIGKCPKCGIVTNDPKGHCDTTEE